MPARIVRHRESRSTDLMRRNDFPRLIFQLTPVRTAVTRMQQSSSHRARVLDDATASNVGQAECFEQLRPGETVQHQTPTNSFWTLR